MTKRDWFFWLAFDALRIFWVVTVIYFIANVAESTTGVAQGVFAIVVSTLAYVFSVKNQSGVVRDAVSRQTKAVR